MAWGKPYLCEMGEACPGMDDDFKYYLRTGLNQESAFSKWYAFSNFVKDRCGDYILVHLLRMISLLWYG